MKSAPERPPPPYLILPADQRSAAGNVGLFNIAQHQFVGSGRIHTTTATSLASANPSCSGSRARLHASLIFVPEFPDQVATGVKVMEFFDRPFAVRGRGHTLHPGMSGIENGILFSMERMDKITLAASKQVASLGPGNDWGRVFKAMENEGIAVTGGQLGVVGVPGLLTGNGLSHFISSRGFSSADVVNFQVVLAGGNIVDANATSNADLWWALKGGINNFGIVTRFDMATFPLPNGVWSGTLSYDRSQAKAVAEALYELQTGPLLEEPHLDVPYMEMIIPGIGLATVDATPFTDIVNFTGCYPSAIKPLYNIGPQSVTASRKTLTQNTAQDVTPVMELYDKRLNRANLNVKASRELYREMAGMLFEHYNSSTIAGHTIGVSWNPITPHVVRETNRKGGVAGGWQEVNQNSVNLRVNWDNAADDAAAIQMDDAFMEKLTEAARKWDALLPNQWANNAADHVDVMRSYGDANFEKLRQVSRKYDGNQTFQRLCSGGYKLR
ncbi:Mitomycin radical oxidase [Colletotrichum higginsianum IMI 349063]|uniref:Mitomycin radical oxidase n=1 Tax=Colletotrichum higginsianum (strain IMI 349063) TaxID=759273 RepID=A0A1B7YGJ9_COLHI|nr:Mitomycin radical oxidase [Colletotrichum higginsianum IMI 349063]OBR11291.1 Mitomycin radical oxidase [Colletotrichum higginsianum IMI 349063]